MKAKPRAFRLAEHARAGGRTDVELVYLWNAFEEARTLEDHEAIEHVRARATELQARGVDEAGALVAAAEAALAANGGGARLGAPSVGAGQRAMRRALAWIGLVVGLAIFIAFQVGVRVLLASESERFERPPVEVVAYGRGVVSPRPILIDGLYLTPADRTPARLPIRIGRAIHQRYGVRVTVLPRIRSEQQAVDRDRHQIDAIRLSGELERASPASAAHVVVIAVTHADMFSSEVPDDRFSFGVHDYRTYAVISTARMDPRNYGRAADPALLERRLEKIVLRYFGELYFGLPRNGNENSVLRKSIRSLDDLDEMTREFCPDRPGAIASC